MTHRLRCTHCGREYDPAIDRYLCDICPSTVVDGVRVHQGLLEISYELDSRPALTRATLGGPGRGGRYRALLPEVRDEDIVSLGEGATPFLPGDRIARAVGLARLHLKVETTNPTGAFKDRETSVAISVGRSLGAAVGLPGTQVADKPKTGDVKSW